MIHQERGSHSVFKGQSLPYHFLEITIKLVLILVERGKKHFEEVSRLFFFVEELIHIQVELFQSGGEHQTRLAPTR